MLDVETIINDEVGCLKRRSSVRFTEHARSRSLERNVSYEQCREVFANGIKEPADDGRWMYTGEGVRIITDPESLRILSVWRTPAHGIVLNKFEITPAMAKAHRKALKKVKDKASWTSHTVAVVDQSGSMRKIDMEKLITRSDLVWLHLAVTVVAKCLQSGDRKDSDVLSVICMRDKSDVVLHHQPFDWVLYNKLVDLLRNSQPSGGGCYVPALEKATELLCSSSRLRQCALSLLFLSDGQPSDKTKRGDGGGYERLMKKYATAKITELASAVGKRLSICGVGIGQACKHEFRIINAMIKEAEQYECPVVFEPSCVSSSQVSTALLTTTQTTTIAKTHISEIIEHEVLRDFKKQPLREVGRRELGDTWEVVNCARIVDPLSKRSHCTVVRTRWVQGRGWISYRGDSLFVHPDAVGVAFEKRWFGEGRERLVKEFREIDKCHRFVGPSYVAKDSITIHQDGRQKDDNKLFHKKFCQTHLLAQEAADKFNELCRYCSLTGGIPEIQFLECSVYMLILDNGEREGFLVEPMLDFHRYPYQKFNDNQGGVSLRHESGFQSHRLKKSRLTIKLEPIYEESDEESDGGQTSVEHESGIEAEREDDITAFPAKVVPQVFSCFSCFYFYQEKLVCDLQGIHDESLNVLRLTDPVVHQRRSSALVANERYGRTDRGDQGIGDFKKTHRCVPLCHELRSLLRDERHHYKRSDNYMNAD